MAWYTMAVIYFVVWWITVFAVLPVGIRPETQQEEGHSPGAPKPVNWPRKLLATSLIALVLTFAVARGFQYIQTEFRKEAREQWQKKDDSFSPNPL